MAHFAKVKNGIVTEVLVISQDVINTGAFGDPILWIQTSYNTHGNIHYGQDGQPDGGIALRGNYAGVGYIYDSVNDVFYEPKPFDSWILNTNTWTWEAPTPMPIDDKNYIWDESTKSWIEEIK
jgi:hypothetical protein